MKKLEIKGINYELLEELDLSLKNTSSQSTVVTNTTTKDFINRTINSWIETTKGDIHLGDTIRELDIQELKKLDAVLYRDQTVQTPSSIKASDLSNKAIDLYAAMVSRVYKMTVRECQEAYSGETLERLTQGYQNFTEGIIYSNGDKSKKFDSARKAMALLRSTAAEKGIETAPIVKI